MKPNGKPKYTECVQCPSCREESESVGLYLDSAEANEVGWCENGHVWIAGTEGIKEVYNFHEEKPHENYPT